MQYFQQLIQLTSHSLLGKVEGSIEDSADVVLISDVGSDLFSIESCVLANTHHIIFCQHLAISEVSLQYISQKTEVQSFITADKVKSRNRLNSSLRS